MPNVYWLAIDKNGGFATYEELQDRGVIAQGWSSINLQNLFHPSLQTNESLFKQGVLSLGNQVYSDDWWVQKDCYRVPRIMWMLASLKKGDLIVGIEGTRVRGICEVQTDGFDSYQYQVYYKDDGRKSEYVNTFGGKVQWVDWCPYRIGKPPRPPAQSVKGIANLWSARDYVLDIWKNLKPENLRYSIGLVEETLRVHESLMDGMIYPGDDKVFFKHCDGRVGFFVSFGNVYCSEWILEDMKGVNPPMQFSDIKDLVRAGWVLD